MSIKVIKLKVRGNKNEISNYCDFGVYTMTEKEFLKPIRRFNNEMKKLRRWYFSTIDSYERSIKVLENEIEGIKSKGELLEYGKNANYFRNEEEKFFNIDYDIRSTIKKYKKNNYIKYLEEMVLIRIVTLIEILIYEVLVETYSLDENIFYGNQEITITLTELLSGDKKKLMNEYIEKLLSKYKRKGFRNMCELLRKFLKIDPKGFYAEIIFRGKKTNFSFKEVVKIHDERHLVIHQNGQTDEEYRHEYGVTNKTLKWNEDEIIYKLKLAEEFSSFLEEELKLFFLNSAEKAKVSN